MLLEIKKELSPSAKSYHYCIYIDGKFQRLESTFEEAMVISKMIIKISKDPILPETIYSEEF